MSNDIQSAVQSLLVARDAAASHQSLLAHVRKEFEERHADLLAAVSRSAQAVVDAERHVRELALHAYAETKSKAPAPGIGIRVNTVLRYDVAEAFEWAQEHRLCLMPESLDVRGFEKLAKATPLPFVTAEDAPVAIIATDLRTALEVNS